MSLSKFTPLGRADKILSEEIEQFKTHDRGEYRQAVKKYRTAKTAQLIVKILLYAGIITSFAATFALRMDIIARISSYVGITILLALYSGLTYIASIYRETYLVRRELLISQSVDR
ncbi:MAG: hypothetical protein ABEJ87_05485 [Candidatus Nanohalobium sp.]